MRVRDLDAVNQPTVESAVDSANAPSRTSNEALPRQSWADQNKLAESIASSYGAATEPAPPVMRAAPRYTFGAKEKPAYNPNIDQIGTSPSSDNGQVAANALLRLEQSPIGPFGVADEAQYVTEALAKHKDDPVFLQQYFGTLGPERTAAIFRYLTSLGHVSTPYNFSSPTSANAAQLKQQFQDMAEALSTMVKSNDFSQNDMDRLVNDFAKDSPESNFSFAKDVLSQASPQVNQMFYQSAKNYALQHLNSSAGQAMAAYSMQALYQSPNAMSQLANLPSDQLSSLVKAALQGGARYGNPVSPEEFAKTGTAWPENGKGEPLDGLSNLMFNAAYADAGGPFTPPQLTTAQAHALQTKLFQASVGALQSDPSLHAFYNKSIPMKDALSADFQQGYDSIVKANSGRDGELTSTGMQNFQEFFGDVLFNPPPASDARGVAQFFQNKVNSFVSAANRLAPGAQGSQAQLALATSLGEQSEAMALALKQSLASVLAGQTKSSADTQNILNTLLTTGEAGLGALGVAPAIGAAIVGEALKQLVSSGGAPSVQSAINDLKKHGIDVSKYANNGTLQDQSENILNYNLRLAFQNGLNNAYRVLN